MTERIEPPVEYPLPQQMIDVDLKQGYISLQAFTSPPFAALVSQGADRVRVHNAESGFSVITNGSRIIYSPMQFGTGRPDTISARYAGLEIGTQHGLEEINLPLDDTSPTDYTILGTFHFHPIHKTYVGFSQPDIEYYERVLAGQEVFNVHLNYFFGVFLSIPGPNGTSTTKLFMIQGRPNNTLYQGEDFNGKSVERQKVILERSGFRTFFVDIPIAKRIVNLRPLRLALQRR